MATFGEQPTPNITTQGLITVNADLDPNIVASRQQLAAVAPYGASIIGASAIDATRLQIEEGELLLTPTETFQFGGKSMSTRRAMVFSSFNGIFVPRGKSQAQFEEEYMFVGMAQNATFPEGDPGGMGNGIAVKRAGSGTTLNNSTVTFCPGDVIGYRLPNVDETERAREVPSVAGRRVGTERYRPNKHTAILRKVTYKEISEQYNLAVAELLDRLAGFNVPAYDKEAGSGKATTLSPTAELGVLIKKAFGWAFVSAVQAGIDNQVLKWNSDFVRAASDAERVEVLAAKLGLVDPGATGEDTQLQNEFLLRALRGSLGRTTTAMQERAVELLDKYSGVTRQSMPTFGQFGRPSKVPEQLKDVAASASYGLVRAWGKCMNNFERTTIATASCFSAPGQSVDYILRP